MQIIMLVGIQSCLHCAAWMDSCSHTGQDLAFRQDVTPKQWTDDVF